MKRNATITFFYIGVAVLSAAILALAFYVRSRYPEPDLALIVNSGNESVSEMFAIQNDLTAVNQDGQSVKLSDLKGKVWLVAEFFAVCPHCAMRNGAELRAIYDEFRGHPDFQIVCISVDPENDKQEKLTDYAKALGADTKNWWFLNAGEVKTTHEYLEHELKFFGIRERKNPVDIESNGRYEHDMGFLLVNRNLQVVGKWPLADARSDDARKRDPGLYDRLRNDLFHRIRGELGSATAAR